MKRITFSLLLSIAAILAACNFAYAQRTSRITRPCPSTATPASVSISTAGAITLAPCSGQTVALPAGTTFGGSSISAGSVLFGGFSGEVTQDNSNLYFDDSNNRLVIGNAGSITTANSPKMQFVFSGNNSPTVEGVAYTTNSWQAPTFTGYRARGTLGTPTAVQALDGLAVFSAGGHNGSGFATVGSITISAAETFSGTNRGTYIDFSIAPIGSSSALPYARLRTTSFSISSANQFGWDTASPIPWNGAGTVDTGFARYSAGVIRATDGSTAIRGLIGGGAAVASAAALPLPTGRVFHVTGTTSITSITSTNFAAGVCITLIFDGALTFTDGGNLALAGNFVTTADDTISLCYDGSNWYETGRSVN